MNIFRVIPEWLVSRRIKRMGLSEKDWEKAVADWPVMQRYHGAERDALRNMAFHFLAIKQIVSGRDFIVTDDMCLKLAAMACVPVLHLGLDWYDHWQTMVVYEDDFIPQRAYKTEDGVVHDHGPGLSGEAWLRGPVIISWDSVLHSGPHVRHDRASNVVIHEVAHKLDMLRDGANGAPPMHPDMKPGEWHDTFTAAWDQLQWQQQHHRALPIDGYGLESPAEFFAVCSETFFEAPKVMQKKLPEVYDLLSQFYRQAPI